MPKIGNIEFEVSGLTPKPNDGAEDKAQGAETPVENAVTAPADEQVPTLPPTEEAKQDQAAAAPVADKQPKEWELLMQDTFYRDLTAAYLSGDTDKVEALMSDRVGQIKEVKKNYDAMSSDDLIRAKVQREYPDLTGAALSKAVERYYAANFGEQPDEEDEGDYQLYQATMNRHAQKLRQEFKADQEKVGAKSLEQIKQEFEALVKEREQSAAQAQKEWEQQVLSVPQISAVLKDGAIKIGKSDAPVNFKVDDTEKYKKALTADQEFFNLFSTGNKESPIDLTKWAKVVAYAMNPDGFEAALLAAGSSNAKENILDELTNPAKPQPAGVPSPSTLFDAMLGAINNKKKK